MRPAGVFDPRERRAADRRILPPDYGVDRRGSGTRTEVRFLTTAALGAEVRALAEMHLQFTDGATPWYTTTYCDTADHFLYREAEAGAGSLLRLREYDNRRPESALRNQHIWVEWKDEERERSQKQRFIIRPEDVEPLLRGEPLETGDLLLALRNRAIFARGLRPVVITQCRRTAYASRRDELRITLDQDLSYFLPELVDGALAPCELGHMIARESGVLVEVKSVNGIPEWAESLLQTLRRQASGDRPSKFVIAMRYLRANPALSEAVSGRSA